MCPQNNVPDKIEVCKDFNVCLRWRANEYCENDELKMFAICEEQGSKSNWIKVDEKKCTEHCPYEEIQKNSPPSSTFLEIQASERLLKNQMHIATKFNPNVFKCNSVKQKINKQGDQIFRNVAGCKPTFSCQKN
jgi:hypothetical protein